METPRPGSRRDRPDARRRGRPRHPRRAERPLLAVLRPILDFAQTMPAFVYLMPAVALFLATRFTAHRRGRDLRHPAVVRLVEIGIRTVPPRSARLGWRPGATQLQLLRKVELPVALPALLVAANQGIIMVLAMVVSAASSAAAASASTSSPASADTRLRRGLCGRDRNRPPGDRARPDHPGRGPSQRAAAADSRRPRGVAGGDVARGHQRVERPIMRAAAVDRAAGGSHGDGGVRIG